MPTSHITDLTQHAPRSARVRLGGYATLPRMLDKGRASVAGKNGEYHYACPLDQRLLDFIGIDSAALRDQLATGKSDSEILAWINQNARNKHSEIEIAAWSAYQEQRVTSDTESREFFQKIHSQVAPKRTDIATWFELLDVDDYVSFGGAA